MARLETNVSRYHVSEQFEMFLMERISGPEFDFFQRRVGPLALYPARHGLFAEDFQAKGSKRTVRFGYYYSVKLMRLFVLGAHLVRRGEPTDLDQDQMDAFMEAIRDWEFRPGEMPKAFRENGD